MSETGARRVVGVDIGGTGLKFGVVRFSGDGTPRVEAEQLFDDHAEDEPEAVLDRLAAALAGVIAASVADPGPEPPRVAAVGVGCAGLVDTARGVLHRSTHLPGWRDVPLADGLSRRLGLPVLLANDAACFLAAEWRHGAARGLDHALFVTIGTGVGGGLVLAGRPYRGASGLGAELGHMSIDRGGPECPCGGRGCLELFVGRKAIEREALRVGLAAEGVRSPADVSRVAATGDPRARAILAEAGRCLGLALAGLVNLLEPRGIVVGGGVAQAGDLLLEPARVEMVSRSMVARQSPVPIIPAALGALAGLVGAASLASAPERP